MYKLYRLKFNLQVLMKKFHFTIDDIKNTRDAFIRNKLLQTRISISECSIIHRNAFDSYPSANKKL